MSVIELDFHEPDDTLIGTLTDDQLIECELRPALQELGAISFTVSRHLAEASTALLAKGNLVKVRIPVVDADPIALFVLKDDASQLLSRDEQGGEHLTLTGPGGLHMLSYARLREEVYAPEQPTRGDWDDDVSWNWRGRAYGAILVRIIEEGQNQPGTPLSEITLDFDRLVDSDGIPWAVIAEDFTVPIGIDVLTVANRLATAGDLYLVLTPDLVLHAYQTYGRDLTGAFAADNVRFEKGVNILTELQRKTRQSRVTHLITRDVDQIYRTFITPDAFDQAVYGFLEVASTNDPDQVEKIALAALSASDEGQESYLFESLPGDDPEGGEYLPGPEGTDGHLWPGDAVTIHTGTGEHDLNAQSVTLSAVSIVLDIAADDSTDERAARSLRIVPEVSFGVPLPAFSERDDPANAGAPGCVCLKLCQPSSAVPTVVSNGVNPTGTAGHNIEVPTGLTNSLLLAFGGWRRPLPFTASYDPDPGSASAMDEVAGSEVTQATGFAFPDQEIHGVAFERLSPAISSLLGGYQILDSTAGGTQKAYVLAEDVDQANPIAQIVVNSGDSAVASATLSEGTGLQYVHFMYGHDPADAAAITPGAGLQGVSTLVASGEHVAIGYGVAAGSWTFGSAIPWVVIAVSLRTAGFGGDGVPQPVGGNNEGDHGTAIRVTRCDHVHGHSDLSEHDDEIHHAIASIEGLEAALAAAITDHGALTGLADNDHPQYQTEAEVTAQIEALRWEAVTDGEDVFVWEDDDLVHEWKAY